MEQYNVLVCGSRDYNNIDRLEDILLKSFLLMAANGYEPVLINGAARGADNLAAAVAMRCNLKIKQFPPDWVTYGKAAGPKRNLQMVGVADIVIAFLRSDRENKGTRCTIEMAKKKGIRVIEVID